MERAVSKKKSEGQKKTLIHVSVPADSTKLAIIKSINEDVRAYNEAGGSSLEVKAGEIPVDPIPNVSFWINFEDEKYPKKGITITRKSGKYGWSVFKDHWTACLYMQGTGLDKTVLSEKTESLLNEHFDDCCGKRINERK